MNELPASTATGPPTTRLVPPGAPPKPDAVDRARREPNAGDPGAAGRCPHCRARQDVGISWCSQCYADLRTGPVPAPDPAPVPAVANASGTHRAVPDDPRTPGPAAAALSTDAGASPTPSPHPVDAEELDRITVGMLAELAAVPARSGIRGLLDTGLGGAGAKTVVVVVGTLVVAVVGFTLMSLMGALL